MPDSSNCSRHPRHPQPVADLVSNLAAMVAAALWGGAIGSAALGAETGVKVVAIRGGAEASRGRRSAAAEN
jgi:hypothetical protein